MLSEMTNVLTIAGSDPVGGAGVQADIKAIEAMGLHACTVVTCLTAQNTRGVQSISPVPPGDVGRQLDSVLADVDIGAAKTGMLYDAGTVKAVSKRLRRLKAPLVVDPVMRATTGGTLSVEGFVEALREELLPTAALVTPNMHEARALTGVAVRDLRSARKAADELMRDGAKAVLVKGGHGRTRNAVDYFFVGGKVEKLTSPRVKGEFHGTGCVLSAFTATGLAKGETLETAVREAKAALYTAILSSERIGGGVPCVNPMSVVRAEALKATVLEELNSATTGLQTLLDARLLPEVGSNMGFATPWARGSEDVAAFEGRIVRVGEKARATGCARFGASKHVARIVLAAHARDPAVRCALNIKYTARTTKACRDSGLKVASFDRSREPKRTSSMTWGVNDAIERHGSVPDVIYDCGGVGKEPMIRLLGESPADVLTKLKRIAAELD